MLVLTKKKIVVGGNSNENDHRFFLLLHTKLKFHLYPAEGKKKFNNRAMKLRKEQQQKEEICQKK